MKLKLTRGLEAILDEEDYNKFSSFKWFANQKGKHFYACRGKRIGLRSENKHKYFYLHREILGAKKGEYVDHLNGNTLDNRRSNLRICTNQQNAMNHNGNINSRKYSKFKGVKKNTNCKTWSARITFNGKEIYLGSFKTEKEAALSYNIAANKYFKEFARLNKV